MRVLDPTQQKFIPHPEWGEFDLHATKNTDDGVLLGTSKGLYRLRETQPGRLELEDLSNLTGLSNVPVFDIEISSSKIYLSVSGGIYEMPGSILNNPSISSTTTYITGTYINGILDTNTFISTLYSTDNIVFNLQTVGFRNQGDRSFSYRLHPLDTNWQPSRNTEISLYNLPSGRYDLQIRSSNGSISHRAVLIQNHYYQEVWFIVLITIFILALLTLPFLYQRQLMVVSERAENEKNALRLRTLTAQLNPHFVFNALSSIQSYILKNDPRKSNDFLVRFARHIRRAPEQSRQDTIPLKEAIDATVDYLELEQLRLDGAFTYEVNISPEVEVNEIDIPVQLMQPYVENAVIHGMTDLDRPGKIVVEINPYQDSGIIIKIMDNGPGIEHTSGQERQKNGHGLGTAINQERIQLINQRGKETYEVQYCPMEKKIGTCVSLIMKF